MPDAPLPSTHATPANLAYIEGLFEDYLTDPGSVDDAWHDTFEQWSAALHAARNGTSHRGLRPAFEPASLFHGRHGQAPSADLQNTVIPEADRRAAVDNPAHDQLPEAADSAALLLQHRVDLMVRNFRVRGHIAAHLNPLDDPPPLPEELRPEHYGFSERDLRQRFAFTAGSPRPDVDSPTHTLKDIIGHMRKTYCDAIAAQFMHIDNLEKRAWLQKRMEATENSIDLTRQQQIRILTRLTDATIFEEFIQKKFIGAKSFSLEGGETLIPLLDLAFEQAGEQDVKEIVIGMAHRGRLNVLANVLGKSAQQIFREFEDVDPELYLGGGDVKYHLGHSGNWRTRQGRNIHLSLCFNPSHLELVTPVGLGRLRAKQDRSGMETRGDGSFGLMIHGDAAFAGEGVVQETLNLSQLAGYRTGGTLHVIVNNQVGFTTDPRDARSGRYCTDIAKMLQVPIFHVNGERPEAVAQVVSLAMAFRKQFKSDVVVDLYCYRRRGHNEGDEPSYTQPRMYERIRSRKTVREAYLESLIRLGGVTAEDGQRIAARRTELLEKDLNAARADGYEGGPALQKREGHWARYSGGADSDHPDVDTAVDRRSLASLMQKQAEVPEDFALHPKLKRLLRLRGQMADGDRPLDWASAESLAFASLAVERHRVRLSGQDVQRGTFSQRHSVLHDIETGQTYTPLANLSPEQAPVDLYNSPLSEVAVLGFDYGYSLDYPCGLICWEAQFGDFVNVAQPIFDQFIASAEDKWNRLSGLVLLLPHGFEGQGPEHSSARLERFLNQCAEDNIQVCNPTTPAQYFHLLRRQVKREYRKPLVVMTPKSLLRHPACVSSLDDLSEGRFKRVIADGSAEQRQAQAATDRVLLCSGKLYYELLDQREKLGRTEVPIVRLEQYYPFPVEQLDAALMPYGGVPVVWVQEEPRNMGAWHFLKGGYGYRLLGKYDMTRVARRPSASPATGSKAAHQLEQQELLDAAFGPEILDRFRA